MATYIAGSGGGGKGGGGSARVAKEAPNTLKSKNYAKIVEVLCEGEIEGLVSGAESIFLDDVPLQNSDGTYNFDDVVVETREGTLDQGITKIGSTTQVTASVGTEIKQATPVLHTITNPDVDRAVATIRIPALTEQNPKNGDLNGSSVKLQVEYNPNGTGWLEAPVGATTTTLSPTGTYTGYRSYEGSLSLVSNHEIVEIQTAEKSKTVKRYLPMTYTLQYRVNAGSWVTLKTETRVFIESLVRSTPKPTFSLQASTTSTYEFRLLLSGGSGSIQNLSGTRTSGEVTITGKTTSPYERDVEFSLTGSAPWLVRVSRITPDSESAALQNKTFLSTVTSIFEEKFRYPATAYVAISVDAQQFSSIPSRAYDVKLLKIKVPSNYNTETREYSGVWDGTFKVEWSDNPAWCFYDLITNKRYGLGERIEETQVDKWALYDIAQYCDEFVDDGYGGLEPRFTCNVLIQSREEAYKVLQDMASIFAGISYWGSSSGGFQGIIPVQDKPEQTHSYLFNNSNVVDGVFSYQTANNNTQFNTAYVTYNDPLDNYKQKVVYVSDDSVIAEDGYVNETNVVAFGCTSKAQAIRLGRRILYTNKYENDVVSFAVGADGAIPSIGSIIQVSDELRTGERRGGRITDVLSTTSIKIDKTFTILPATTYKLSVIDFSGVWHEVVLTNSPTTTDTLTFTPAIIGGLAKNSPYIIADTSVEAALYKVVANTENDQQNYNISAVKHTPTKYGYIDDLIPSTEQSTSVGSTTDPVTDLSYSEILYSDGINVKSKLVVSWKPARFSSNFIVNYKQENSNVTTLTTLSPTFEILDTTPSTYFISVVSTNTLGGKSLPAEITVEILGKIAPPSIVTNLAVSSFANAANITWDKHPDLDVQVGGAIEIRHTPKTSGQRWEDGSLVTTVNGGSVSAITSLLQGTYMAKALDSSGIYSLDAAFADSSFAEIQNLNVVATSIQQPSWSGARTNTYVKTGGILSLDSSVLWDSVNSVDALSSVDLLDGQYANSGEYFFDNVIDLGGVLTSRISGLIESFAYEAVTLDTWDSRLDDIDTWTSIDGSVINDSYVTMYISTTLDDPNNIGAVWGGWERLVVSDYKARGLKFKLVLTNTKSTNTIDVYRAEVVVDVPDRVEGADNIISPVGGYTVTYPFPFYVKPSVAIRIDNMQTGDYTEFTTNTASGFTVKFKDSTNTYVSRQFDYISKGYGYILP